MTTNTGGPAFPAAQIDGGCDGIGNKDGVWHFPGMTLRDYFAAKVLQGAMVNAVGMPDMSDEILEVFCGQCYRMADHMIKAREL